MKRKTWKARSQALARLDPKRISTSVRLRRPYTPFLKRDPNSLD